MVDAEENPNHTVAWYEGDYTEISIAEARRLKAEHRCPKRRRRGE
jgi:hypothetical protein